MREILGSRRVSTIFIHCGSFADAIYFAKTASVPQQTPCNCRRNGWECNPEKSFKNMNIYHNIKSKNNNF